MRTLASLALVVLVLVSALILARAPLAVAQAEVDVEAAPTSDQISSATDYLEGRRGRTAFAVIDSEGELSGVRTDERFVTASVVKAMLLVQYLRKVDRADRDLTAAERRLLAPMIRVSSNQAATAIWQRVGDAGLLRLANVVGMTDFVIGPGYIGSCRCSARAWARAQITAGDQARLFFELDSVLPERFRVYAKTLLETVVAQQSWGIPAAARPAGWRAFYKVGLRATGLGGLIHQASRLEREDSVVAIAVLTDGDPTYAYGKRTVREVGERLVGAGAADPQCSFGGGATLLTRASSAAIDCLRSEARPAR